MRGNQAAKFLGKKFKAFMELKLKVMFLKVLTKISFTMLTLYHLVLATRSEEKTRLSNKAEIHIKSVSHFLAVEGCCIEFSISI